MKQVFEVNTVTEGHLSTYDVRDALHDRCNTMGVWVKDVTTEPVEDASTGIKKIFEIEYKKGHQPVVSHEMKSMLASYTTGLVGVKDVSKDVAILRGQEPKPFGWRGAGPAPNAEEEAVATPDLVNEYRDEAKQDPAIGGCEHAAEEALKERDESSIRGKLKDLPIVEKMKKHIEQLKTELRVIKDGATQERELLVSAVKKLKTQLSECGLAANGATHVERDAKGWSVAYQEVSQLRMMFEDASANYRKTVDKLIEVEDKPLWGKSIIETLNEEREKARKAGVDEAYKNMRMKSSILLSEAVAIRDEVSLQGGDLSITDMCGIFETIGITIKNDLPGVES